MTGGILSVPLYLERHEQKGVADMDYQTMKEIPGPDRPYERCERLGPEALTDAELLSIIIRTGARGEHSLSLAQRILALNEPQGILGLLHLTLPELMAVKGIGRVKGLQLLCIGELSRRIWKTLAQKEIKSFDGPESIAAFYMEDMRHMEQEELHLMMFNTKNMLIRESCLFRGTVNASVASAREIFIEALRYHAVRLALVHNHPSGDPSPSGEDIRLTRQVAQAGELLGVTLLDHVIIGDNSYFSFKERGLI